MPQVSSSRGLIATVGHSARAAVFPQHAPCRRKYGVARRSFADAGRSCPREPWRMPTDELTEREQAAALLLAYGPTNRDVARELNVSVRTVESERARLMRKLGFARRAELVRWALERGLLH